MGSPPQGGKQAGVTDGGLQKHRHSRALGISTPSSKEQIRRRSLYGLTHNTVCSCHTMAFGETPGLSGPAGRPQLGSLSLQIFAGCRFCSHTPTQEAAACCKMLQSSAECAPSLRVCLQAPEEGKGLTVTQPDSWRTCRAPGCTPGGGRGQGVM